MKLQRIIISFLIFCLICIGAMLSIAAEDSIALDFSTTKNDVMDVNDIVHVTVSLSGCSSAAKLEMQPLYDSEKLKLLYVEWIPAVGNHQESNGVSTITFAQPTDINGELFRIGFSVQKNAPYTDIGLAITIFGEGNGVLASYDSISAGKYARVSICPHQHGSSWDSNENNHWSVCSKCHEDIAQLDVHSYSNNCDAFCNVCNYQRSVSEHTYQTTWNANESTHWFECTDCGNRNSEESHQYDNVCDTDCNVCGAIRTAPHNYRESPIMNAESHWFICEICLEKVNESKHAHHTACDIFCYVCGYERVAPHTPGNAVWLGDETSHIERCRDCGLSMTIAHTFDNNCDTNCNADCGYKRNAFHAFSLFYNNTSHWEECLTWSLAMEATKHTLVNNACACGYTTAPHTHALVYVPAQKTVCTESGAIAHYACSICSALFQDADGKKPLSSADVISPATEHTPVITPAVAATCTEEGKTQGSHCSVCNAVIEPQEPTPMIDHVAHDVYGYDPSCLSPGLGHGVECSRCETVLQAQELIPPLGHNPVVVEGSEPSCYDDGATAGIRCASCGFMIEPQEIIPSEGHIFDDWEIIAEPSEEYTGMRARACVVCGAFENEEIPALTPDEPYPSDDETEEEQPPVEEQPEDEPEENPEETDPANKKKPMNKNLAGILVIGGGILIAVASCIIGYIYWRNNPYY